MSAACDWCNRETCELLALLADVDDRITDEYAEARLREIFRTSGISRTSR